MTSATQTSELLSLLREIEKRGGPISIEEGADDDYACYADGSMSRLERGGRDLSVVERWAIVGALMEDIAYSDNALSEPYLDAITGEPGEAKWRMTVYPDKVGHTADSAAIAAARAWLAAKGEAS